MPGQSLLFDPFPTIWHVLLFASIAVGNGCWRGESSAVPCACFVGLGLVNGLTLGVAIWYTLQTIIRGRLPRRQFCLRCYIRRSFCLASSPYARLLALLATIRNRGILTTHYASSE